MMFPALQATHAFSITPSDTTDIKDDAANTLNSGFCFLHNPGTATIDVRVQPAGHNSSDTPVTIQIASGAVFPLAVRRVYATAPVVAAGELIGLVSKQR